jgi:DNA-binding NtrC family response regulator
MKQLIEYSWPGNVRELQGLIERLTILKREGWMEENELPSQFGGPPEPLRKMVLPPGGIDYGEAVDAFESNLILQALETTGWNKNQAALLLQLKRTTLVEKIRAKGLTPPES